MERPQVARTLKRDQFGRVELLTFPGGQVVRRVADGDGRRGARWIAHRLLRRERRALAFLESLGGVPLTLDVPELAGVASPDGAVPRAGDVLLRSWLPGTPLHAATRLPENFFVLLAELVARLHARGVCHNDLHKEPNILVGPDGHPSLVDFQLASIHPRRGRSYAVRAREDQRHVAKHHRRYFNATGRGTDPRSDAADPRRSFLAEAWARYGKPPYNYLTRRVLPATTDTEPRRPPAGPWPAWDPPVGAGEPPS